MDSISQRIVNRFRQAAAIGDPKDFLPLFESGIRALEIPPSDIEHARKVINDTTELMRLPRDPAAPRTRSMEDAYPGFGQATDLSYTAYFRITQGGNKLADVGHKLFLSIIQTYTLPPALRKKVEVAVRLYLKTVKPRLKEHGNARYLEMFTAYEKYITTLHNHLEIAKQAIAKGKAHTEEGLGATKIKVGSFTLVNTGGFSAEVMENVADVMAKVEALARSSGVGEVLYGEVQVTNTINKSNVLAFYLLASDELFVRANVRATVDTVQTVLHELGHRYAHKTLNNDRGIEQLYQKLNGQEVRRKFDRSKLQDIVPKPGEEVLDRGKKYRVTKALPDYKAVYKILLEQVDDPKHTAHTSLAGWLSMKGESLRNVDTDPNYIGFVTDYAKKGGPGENFAEMFAFYAMGRLPVLQSVPFEELLFGSSKTAHMRSCLRIASRWILQG